MSFCMDCGNPTFYLERGTCGGHGKLIGCRKCKSIFRQTSGGIAPIPGGEGWRKEPYNLDQYYGRKKILHAAYKIKV